MNDSRNYLVLMCVSLCVLVACKSGGEQPATSADEVEGVKGGEAVAPAIEPSSCAADYRVFENRCVRMTPAQFARHSCPDEARVAECDRLARAYLVGDGVEMDKLRAMKLRERVCQLAVLSEACTRWRGLSDAQRREMIEAYALEVVEQRREACRDEDGLSCFNLARRAEDRDMARQYFAMSCDAGFVLGCQQQAHKTEDDEESLSLNQRACDAGVLESCWGMAFSLIRGRGTEKNLERGVTLASTACRSGVGSACEALGGIYLEGAYGVPEDEQEAIEYLKDACDLEEIEACKTLNAMPITTRASFCTTKLGECLYRPGDRQK